MKDWRGVMVQAGDRVVYTTRQGSTMTHHEGDVVTVVGESAEVEVLRNSTRWTQKSPVMVTGKNMTVISGMPPADDSA